MTPPAATSLPAQIARTGRFTRGVPGRFALGADGDTVLFLRSRAGDDPAGCLWATDLPSGAERLLADPAALASATGQGAAGTGAGGTGAGGIDAYGTDRAAALAAFALAGRLWVAEVRTGLVRELPAQGPVTDARPDPAGQRIGYRSGGALRVIGADGAADRPLAAPEGPDIEYGAAGYTEVTAPPDRASGYWWAPDGASLLATRTDHTGVATWYLPDPTKPGEAPRAIRYAAAGAATAEVSLWVLGVDGARIRARWDQRAFEYVVGAGWDARGPYAVVQSRDQRTVRFLAIDPASGATTVLAEQRDDCWVQLLPGLPARTDSGVVVAHADRAGTRHLTVAGAVVTPAGLQVRAVLGIHGEDVLFAASDDPVRTDLWVYRPAGGLTRLTDEAGVHSGIWNGKLLVHVASTGDRPGGRATVGPVSAGGSTAGGSTAGGAVAGESGGRPVPIASLAEWPVLEPNATRLILGARELRANLFWPSWHRPGTGPLPVLLDPYGGAGAQRVTDGIDARALIAQWFAEQGFAVLVADGSGTPGRGPAWEREVYGDLFGPVLDDQVAALHEAARLYPDLDLTRVGIRGWSFSGSLAALAVLRRPDVFHAAVAGAGVTDQLLYEAHWRERFLGHPAEYPERYQACSLLPDAPGLTRPLLLIHGLADDNVHAANTLRLSAALLAAGRPHEVLLLPGVGHSAIGGPLTQSLLAHQARFLRRHLSTAGSDQIAAGVAD